MDQITRRELFLYLDEILLFYLNASLEGFNSFAVAETTKVITTVNMIILQLIDVPQCTASTNISEHGDIL